MKIRDILDKKGYTVATVASGNSVSAVLTVLSTHNIGAVVVLSANGTVVGIASERDVVRTLELHGKKVLKSPVDEIMSEPVITCTVQDSVESVMESMTQWRVRHVPVVDDAGSLVGIVSIGDVMAAHLLDVHFEHEQLVTYLST